MEISRAMTKLQETCRALGRRLERFVGRKRRRNMNWFMFLIMLAIALIIKVLFGGQV